MDQETMLTSAEALDVSEELVAAVRDSLRVAARR